MLAFVVPLKSLQVSASWTRVCELLERTLKSICNQTLSDFKVLVVCHELPTIDFNHPQIHYVKVDFPIPDEAYLSREKDKMRKMLIGATEAKKLNASHVMFVDADDCVSKYLALFVKQSIHSNGWFISQGYDYREDVGVLQIRNRKLHLRTNSSHIIRIDLLESDLATNLDQIKREGCILNHIDTAAILKHRGTPLSPLPFRGTIYVTDNGENMWWSQDQLSSNSQSVTGKLSNLLKALYHAWIRRPVRDWIRDEFGLYDVNPT